MELGFIQSHLKNLKPEDARLSELAFNRQESARVTILLTGSLSKVFRRVLTRV